MKIEVYTMGCSDKAKASYGAVLTAVDDLGRDATYESSKLVGEYTKNQADVIAVIMALRCVKPEFTGASIILNTPSGYASQVLDKNDEGKWLVNPTKNVDLVNEVRAAISAFPGIKVQRADTKAPQFLRSSELALTCLSAS